MRISDTMGRYQNVVLLVLDALRRDRVSLYNPSVDFTENLEELGGESLVFDDAVAQAPWTLPSHASMFTGTYPWEHGATQQSPTFEPTGPTLVDRFAGAGYRTAGFTPNPWVSPFSGLASGFDEWDNFLNPTDLRIPGLGASRILEWWSTRRFERFKTVITDLADSLFETWSRRQGASLAQTDRALERGREVVLRTDRSRPFFLYLNLLDAHEPYYPPDEYRERHAPDVDPRDECQIPSRFLKGGSVADFENIRRLYDASVDYMDDAVGEFVAFLRHNGLLEETVLVVISDHGQSLGEDDRFGHQYGVGPELVSVPMIVRTPGVDPGRIDRLVELRELYSYLPSLAEIGSSYSPGVDIAKGGYGYPDLAIKQIPADRRGQFYNRFRYVLDESEYLVQVESNAGMSFDGTSRETGSSVDPGAHLFEALPFAENGEQEDVDFGEEVRDRLAELGYLSN